ncbi:MAG: hypothetical protein JNL09_01055 [Anaerolineales bacterium]|nr:hypothetical protein [Anaerolineales bacterium]
MTQLFTFVRRWWWLMVLPLLVVGAYSAVTYQAPVTSYSMVLRFTAGQPQAASAAPVFDPNYYRWVTSEYIVGGLKDWIRTGEFANAVSAELAAQNVEFSAAEVAASIEAVDNARSILNVFLTHTNPERLNVLGPAVTKVLQTKNVDVFPQLGGQPAVVTPLDQPSVGPKPVSLSSRLDVLLRLALSLGVGLALALAAYYFDPVLREKAELERLGLKVVAEIPKSIKRKV